ncbi:MAG: TonB-dependent receptor [Verrucomicrobia bacterium]|nr:TonB-dependent receptor [Verrucomicrobiota bacterium]
MTTFLPRSLLLPLCVAVSATLAFAQSAPPAHAHADEPIQLENVVVTASPLARSQADLVSSTSVLTDTALVSSRQATLGETLAAVPGVSSTYFGPGSSRPILRGLGANRVRVLANSTDTLDASNTSPDHAVSVEPFLIKRIEVVRGPASLLYGSAAVGGVVNVIDHRIESELPAGPVSGLLDTSVTDNGRGYATGGSVDVALSPDRAAESGFVLHLDGLRREADSISVPGFSGQPGAPKGELVNTSVDNQSASIGLSYVSEALDAGVNYNGFDSLYGVPNETDVSIDLRQRRLDTSADYTGDFGVFTGARAKLGYADYQHRELAAGLVGTSFTQTGFDSRLELLNGEIAGWTGALGTQLGQTELSAEGDEAFLPTHTTDTGAIFLFEELVRDTTTWQVGARLENRLIDAAPFASPGGTTHAARDDSRTTVSGSFGLVQTLSPAYKIAASLSSTTRAPNGQELYADGPHIGTAAYEIGDASLTDETSLGAEFSLRKTTGFVTGALTGYLNRFDGYIHEQATGALVDATNSPVLPGDPEALTQTRFTQTDALFYGAEAEAIWHLHASNRHTLDLTTALDAVRALDDHDEDLPRTPPLKGRIALDWKKNAWRAGTDFVLVVRQPNTAARESSTAGYALLGLSAGYCLETGPVTYDFFVRAANLTNEEARLHTSFLKDVAPLPGRAFTAGVRANF